MYSTLQRANHISSLATTYILILLGLISVASFLTLPSVDVGSIDVKDIIVFVYPFIFWPRKFLIFSAAKEVDLIDGALSRKISLHYGLMSEQISMNYSAPITPSSSSSISLPPTKKKLRGMLMMLFSGIVLSLERIQEI